MSLRDRSFSPTQRLKRELSAKIAGPDFYKEPADVITRSLERVEAIHQELLHALARWDDLDSRPS